MGTLRREIDEIKPERIVSVSQHWGFSSPPPPPPPPPNTAGLRQQPSVGGVGTSPLVPAGSSDTSHFWLVLFSCLFFLETKNEIDAYILRCEMRYPPLHPTKIGAKFKDQPVFSFFSFFFCKHSLSRMRSCRSVLEMRTGIMQLITQIQLPHLIK